MSDDLYDGLRFDGEPHATIARVVPALRERVLTLGGVSKTARVVEEVALRKEGSDRVETVKDTVRRQDIEIETVPGETTTTTGSLKTPTQKI